MLLVGDNELNGRIVSTLIGRNRFRVANVFTDNDDDQNDLC